MIRDEAAARIEVVDEQVAEILRRMTPAQRIAAGFSLWRSARKMLSSIISAQKPDWTPVQVNAEVVRRMTGGA